MGMGTGSGTKMPAGVTARDKHPHKPTEQGVQGLWGAQHSPLLAGAPQASPDPSLPRCHRVAAMSGPAAAPATTAGSSPGTAVCHQLRAARRRRGAPSLPSPQHQGKQGANLTPRPLLSSLKALKKPGCFTGPRQWTEGSGSGKNILETRVQQWVGAVLSHHDPCSPPQEELELFLDSAGRGNPHFLQGLQALSCQCLGKSPNGLGQGSSRGMGPAPMGQGQYPWDKARTHGIGQDSQDAANMCRVGAAATVNTALASPLEWGFRALSRACRGS